MEFLKVLSPAVKKFSTPSMGEEVHTATRSSIKENEFIEICNDKKGDATSVTSSHSNGSSKRNNFSGCSTPVINLHPQENGKAYQDAEIDKDSSNPPYEAFKSSNEEEKEEMSVDKPELQDPPVKPDSCDDNEEFDSMEQDVKVCDICGDTGQEELLAICCKCTDGAEHTYCMREMLQKVPGGDWLCEECKFANENAAQKSDLNSEGKNSSKAMQVLGKRPAEETGVVCAVKRQALDVNTRSPRMSDLNGTVASSRYPSLNIEKGKGRATHQFTETPRSTNVTKVQVSKNTLLKSKSFSALTAKSKIKQPEEGNLQKPSGERHNFLLDTKIGSLRTLGKSASFKYVNRGGPDSPDSKVKTFPAKFSNVQELKGGSREKNEQNQADRNRLPKLDQDSADAVRSSSISYTPRLDQKSSSRSESHSLSSASDSRDSNIVQSDGRLGSSISKSASFAARRCTDGTTGSAGYLSTDVAYNISVKKRSNNVGPKSGTTGLSLSSEKPCSSGAGNIQDVLTRARESRNHVKKVQESYSGRLGKAVRSGSRTAFCEKCDESGHTAEFCSRGSSQACEVDVSAAKTVRGDMCYGSKSTVPVTSAMLKKPGIYRRNKALDRSDSLSLPNAPATKERSAFCDVLKKSENAMQLNDSNEAGHALEAGASESKWKPLIRELPALSKASTLPEHDYIWQGEFQVRSGSKQIDLYSGFQAHLCSRASPLVHELVDKFSEKIALSEVPRLSSWPFQFRNVGTKEDHIALYFFAQDLQSYERNYKGLLENMMKRDLALKGDLGTVELLIFPSNQLPEKSQRWNMSFYLWGVFMGRRANGSDSGVSEGESSRKKQKTENSGCKGPIDADLFRSGLSGQVHDLNESPAVAENLIEGHGNEAAESCLFPVSSEGSEELKTGVDSTISWKSDSLLENEVKRRTCVHIPDLELALGAETKAPNKEVPVWVDHSKSSSSDTRANSKSSSSDTRAKETEDDERSASLSLSLSFPFPDEERGCVKPFSKEKLFH